MALARSKGRAPTAGKPKKRERLFVSDDVSATDFRFRLKFRVAKRINSRAQEIAFEAPGLARPATLTNATRDQSISDGNWLCVWSRRYPRREEAEHSGKLMADALLLAGAERWTGIDVGFGHALSGFSRDIKAKLAEQGIVMRDDIFGLDVFKDVEVCIPQSQMNLTGLIDPDYFLRSVRDLATLAALMDDRSRMSARLINDALFPLTTEARLIILMTAIESLWESPKRKASIVALADTLLAHLGILEGDKSDKADVAKRVEGIRVESIVRACRDRIKALLGEERAAEFGTLYNVRSRFAHHGAGRSMLHAEGDMAQKLAFDVLIAELQRRKAAAEAAR